jgi:hypothetical protein
MAAAAENRPSVADRGVRFAKTILVSRQVLRSIRFHSAWQDCERQKFVREVEAKGYRLIRPASEHLWWEPWTDEERERLPQAETCERYRIEGRFKPAAQS